jgi:integrase
MGRRPKGEPPKLRTNVRGYAFVEVDGGRKSFGRAGPEARRKYRAWLRAEWIPAQDAPPPKPGCTVDELVEAFRRFAKTHYRTPDGEQTDEFGAYLQVTAELRERFGPLPVDDVRPSHLKQLRAVWVEQGKARLTVNKMVRRIKRVFGWGVEEELVSELVAGALYRVKALEEGRTEARETDPVQPVPLRDLARTLKVVPEPLGTMARVQYYSGARPGEVCRMRAEEIDTRGLAVLRIKGGTRTVRVGEGVWTFQPKRSKTKGKVGPIVYVLGPRCQKFLAPYLEKRPAGFLFSPGDRLEEHRARLRRNRKSKVQPSQRNRRKARPTKTAGERYTTGSYSKAIAAVCKRAGIPPWSPNQLRHNWFSWMDARTNIQTASKAGGHTFRYLAAEAKLKDAAAILARLG